MKTIALFRNKGLVQVDDDLHEELSKLRWHLTCKGYAGHGVVLAGGKRQTIFMHRLVNQTPDHLQTDHINGDKLDNRRANLRSITASLNSQIKARTKRGAHGLRGVSFHRSSGLYQAAATLAGKRTYLGVFKTPEEAHDVYVAYVKKHFPEVPRDLREAC